MKILFDATPLQPNPSGVGFYVTQLLLALSQLQSPEDFQLDVAYQPSLKNWILRRPYRPKLLSDWPRVHQLPLPVRVVNLLATLPHNPFLERLERSWERPDIIHGTSYAVYPSRYSKRVITIYDLTFLKFPQYATAVVKTFRQRVAQCLQWTDLILAISESTKQDLIEAFHLNPEKIWVTPLASRYTPLDIAPDRLAILEKTVPYVFTRPYILFVSTLEPRKNITTLIAAFNLLKERHHLEHQLILIGQKGWNYEAIFNALQASPWQQDIHHLDYLSSEQVAMFYARTSAFVYPSHYEGFGLPPLEAMTLGAPVVVSNTSSLPEVVGEAAMKVDPQSTEALAEAIFTILSDDNLRQTLIKRGYEQAAQFSWQRTAYDTLSAYRWLLG